MKNFVKVPSESIFYSFIKKYSNDIKEITTNKGPEYYIGIELVGKVEHSMEESVYYAKESIVSDVQIQESKPLSDMEIDFINEALAGNVVYSVNIMAMPNTPIKHVYEEAKSRSLSKINKNDFFINKTRTISKEEFLFT